MAKTASVSKSYLLGRNWILTVSYVAFAMTYEADPTAASRFQHVPAGEGKSPSCFRTSLRNNYVLYQNSQVKTDL